MKTSTLLTMALVSASCYAAPLHTSSTDDSAVVAATRAALRVNAGPVAPPAPEIAADSLDHAHWRHVPLPKSRTPSHGMASQTIQVQT
ncbi:hypothetical protein P9250_24760 [Caballeronia sp. LP006]|jgi:hypothetical protein|uniref:hypothetical protein n=1 Tax=unclassified Caballeronia TaxID=2646786 RepID=UPI001FD48961|nr:MULTISPECIES: hypothetical protein [unclassified Caballeronia]MDR5771590.1 hypothetical protein [Caballeronia sp. LZ002]MDR5805375.1 hypothetical protein [Caballeronia sp. LZ001]MDR5831090.1 hypothetical protein [Caballeronia sp. LP006]MDR5847026.1 hypothetical protein [Caballeronia sp. LZ003]